MNRAHMTHIALLAVVLLLLSAVPFNATATSDQAPTAPLDFTVQAGNGQALLSWSEPEFTNASSVSGYWIYRGTPSPLALYATLGNVNTYLDVGLANGQEYSYMVQAVNSAGPGNSTLTISVVPMTTPSAPILPVARPGNMFLNLTWGVPNFDGGSEILGYNIYSAQTGILIGSTDEGHFIHANLQLGTEYEYKVAAFNSAGEGTLSITFSGRPDVIPGVPNEVEITGGVRNVTLRWTPPLDNGGSDLVGYKVYRGDSLDNMILLITLADVGNYTDYGLMENRTYYYGISAFNIVGEGQRSTIVRTDVLGINTITITSVVPGDREIGLYWQTGVDNALPALRYWIYRGDSETNLSLLGAPVTAKTVQDTGLINGVTYYYQVAAENPSGMGWSNIVNATPCTPPLEPLNLTGHGYDQYVALWWNAPSDDGGSPTISYKVYMSVDGSGMNYYGEANSTNFTAAGLTVGTNYTFQVSAVNSAGEGALSAPFSTICGMTPSTVTITTVNSGEGFVSLQWTPPEDSGTGDVLGYYVYRTVGDVTQRFRVFDPSFIDTEVTNGVTYVYSVSAYNQIGTGEASQSVEATPFYSGTTPHAPQNVTAVAGVDYIFMTWVAPDDGGQSIRGYEVYRGLSPEMLVYSTTVQETWYNDTDLPTDSTYYYKIVAKNVLGRGNGSEVVNATTGAVSVKPTASGDWMSGFFSGPLPYMVGILLAVVIIVMLFRRGIGNGLGSKKPKGKKKNGVPPKGSDRLAGATKGVPAKKASTPKKPGS